MKFYSALLLGSLILLGCPHPPTPPAGPSDAADLSAKPAPSVIPSCPIGTTETPDKVCDRFFTTDGHACVIWSGGQGCIDHKTEVYCIKAGGCAHDSVCQQRKETIP